MGLPFGRISHGLSFMEKNVFFTELQNISHSAKKKETQLRLAIKEKQLRLILLKSQCDNSNSYFMPTYVSGNWKTPSFYSSSHYVLVYS